MPAFFAFLHHAAAFALVCALAVELITLRQELTVRSAQLLQRVDAALGISAMAVLGVGFARVVYLEKGAAYYFHNAAFLVKLATFILVALLSAYPTVVFLSWRKATREGRAPVAAPARIRALRAVVHAELAGVLLILLCAALMARGIGQLG